MSRDAMGRRRRSLDSGCPVMFRRGREPSRRPEPSVAGLFERNSRAESGKAGPNDCDVQTSPARLTSLARGDHEGWTAFFA